MIPLKPILKIASKILFELSKDQSRLEKAYIKNTVKTAIKNSLKVVIKDV